MLLEFAESGCPIFRATTPLSRGQLKSKGHGKLSIHFAADLETIESISRIIVSANHLSFYGAVAEMCEEYYSPGNRFERFRGLLELLSRFEFDFRRCGFSFWAIRIFWFVQSSITHNVAVHVHVLWPFAPTQFHFECCGVFDDMYVYTYIYGNVYVCMYCLCSVILKVVWVRTWKLVNPAWEGQALVEARGDTDVHIVRYGWRKGRQTNRTI